MKKIIFLILIIAEIFMMGIVYAQTVNENLSDNLLRLHIIANSDKDCDQKIKLMVRDRVIEHIKCEKLSSKEDVVYNLKIIEGDIKKYLKDIGADYECKVFYTKSEFPEKNYNNVSLPSGNYETIKVILGNGDGKNWWCIAFPPLCFTESVRGDISKNGEEQLTKELDKDVYEIIKNNKGEYNIKFKTVDMLNKIKKLIM